MRRAIILAALLCGLSVHAFEKPSAPAATPASGAPAPTVREKPKPPVKTRVAKKADTAPAGASARCRDGTYSFSKSRRGTCSHHGGVATWL